MEPSEFARTSREVAPIDPWEFCQTIKGGLFTRYGRPAPAHVYETDGLQLVGADIESLIEFLRIKYNPDFTKGSSILYRFDALEKILKDDRALHFISSGEGSLIVHRPLVEAAAVTPLEGNFDLPLDPTFETAAKILADPKFAQSAFRAANRDYVREANNETRAREGVAICINCAAEFDPTAQNPFGPFTCSFHPREPQSIGNTGPKGDHAELWYFPCCGKREVGQIDNYGNDVMPSQSPGCTNSFHRAASALMFISYSRRDNQFAYFLETELMHRFHETDHIGPSGIQSPKPHPEEPCEARRLEGWTLARSCMWPFFETRARTRSSGRGRLIDHMDMIRTSETMY
jgi:hypothetical protein